MQSDQANTTNNVDTFLQNLLIQKGLTSLDAESKEAIMIDLHERLDEFIMVRTMAELSDEDVEQVEKMLDEGKDIAEIRAFAAERINDYTTFLTSTLLEFQDVYLSGK